jgi:hypothetical protein
MREMHKEFGRYGVTTPTNWDPALVAWGSSEEPVDITLERSIANARRVFKKEPSLVFVVLPDTGGAPSPYFCVQ